MALLSIVFQAGDDALDEFKTWFNKYKKGEIDLYQSSSAPLPQKEGEKYRYFKTENKEEMDRLLKGLAERNDLKAVKLLIEAASFRFSRQGEVEKKRYYRQQPWTLRAHALDALKKITDSESLEWIRQRCLKNESGWEAPFRRIIAAEVFGFGRTPKDFIDLKDMLNDRDPRVRIKALEALGRTGGPAELKAVVEGMDNPEPEVRTAAIEAVGGILARNDKTDMSSADPYLKAVINHLNDPEWQVQESALTVMERLRSLRSISALILFLEKTEQDPSRYRERIVQRALDVLRSLTGAPLASTDAKTWGRWWHDNRDTFELASAPPPSLNGFQLEVPYFFNIPVKSDAIFFILDVSGSMGSPLASQCDLEPEKATTNLMRARQELLKTVGSLDSHVRFNIILFNDKVSIFSNNPVPATEESIEKAKSFFESVPAEGGTNLFDALNMALRIKSMGLMGRFGEDIHFDTIFLLSDGVPTKGIVIDPDEILRIITHANRLSKIKINTIYLGDESSRFMRELAENNLGKYIHIQ